jgi:hypothetical protein
MYHQLSNSGLTGVNRAPKWKDSFDNARDERMLEAVGSSARFGTQPGIGLLLGLCTTQRPLGRAQDEFRGGPGFPLIANQTFL